MIVNHRQYYVKKEFKFLNTMLNDVREYVSIENEKTVLDYLS